MSPSSADKEWVVFNPNTHTYDTPDGTSVAAELVDNAQCLLDVWYIASIRQKQREEKRQNATR